MQITKEYNGKPVHIEGSLSSLHCFESLPEDTQKELIKLFGVDPRKEVSVSPALYTKEEMIEAYEAGFEDAAEQMQEPWLSVHEATEYVNSLRKRN